MTTKKIVFISIGVVTIAVLLFLGTSMFKFQSLSDQYVKLKPGMEERIVLVNIGDGDRKYFAEKILEISACNPKVIGVDLFFDEFDKSSELDSLLLASIEHSNCILGTRHGGMGTYGVHKTFLEAAKSYGYAELDADEDGYAVEFLVYRDGVSKTGYHLAYHLAQAYDSDAASVFQKSLSGGRSDIVITKLTDQFRIFDYQDVIDCEKVKDRIVILAYLGPTDEDKKKTYARYHDDSDQDGPDMHGAVIVANQVLMMIGE